MILGVISLLLDWYVFKGLQRITAGWKSARLRKTFNWGYWTFLLGFLIFFAYGIYTRFETDRSTQLSVWGIAGFLTLLVTKLVFVLVLFAEDIVRLVIAAFRFFAGLGREAAREKPLMPARRKFVSQVALALAAVPFVSFLYGIVKGKYDYTVYRHTLYFEDLPEAFDGFTITQVSDVHAGSFDDAEAVQRGIDMIKAQKSDLFVFTGDLVNDQATEIVPYMGMFSQIKAPYGQFSILGNHDYGMYHDWPSEEARLENIAQLKQYHAQLGYRLLLDESVSIEKDGQQLSLVGVENWGEGFIKLGDLDKALLGVPDDAFKVLLSHDPSHWDNVVKNHPAHVHLTLSGHTHGMQVGVETPLVRWSPAQYRYENWAGLAKAKDRLLYVNRGFGFIGFSGRVGIWPEITVLELKRGKPQV